MSNGLTELELFNNQTNSTRTTTAPIMTLDNHHNHNEDGDTAAATQLKQGVGTIENENVCNNSIQLEQQLGCSSTATATSVQTPCSPPGNGGLNNDKQHIVTVNTSSDTTISTAVGNTNTIITLMQSSPPPHSYRHSRAYRHFKNPPQPHMCIRTTTESGEELFINVLSWTRIVIPQEPSDPIPLYGGMRVPPGSPRSPPIVFAVMANPEVLKDSGRHSKDPEERRAMVELMCDFVEAMNPGVKLVRNAVILKDRDISGELKDVWNAVQAQRDREREEQMIQQRQQQHYHNITTQQMFPKSGENNSSKTITTGPMTQQMAPQYQYALQQQLQQQQQQQQVHYIDSEVVQMSTENELASMPGTTHPETQYFDDRNESNKTANVDDNASNTEAENHDHSLEDSLLPKSNNHSTAIIQTTPECGEISNNAVSIFNGNNEAGDQTDAAGNKAEKNVENLADNKANISPRANNNNSNGNSTATGTTESSQKSTNVQLDVVAMTIDAPSAAINSSTTLSLPSMISCKASTQPTPAPTPVASTLVAPPTKKDKLGGFLPNGCIFPRFKHNKNKDKDKDKDSKGKDKEKTLLNALKKSKEKKVAPSEQLEKPPTSTVTTTPPSDTSTLVDSKSQYDKNFINLESEVERLDLNKIDTTTSNDNSMFIKLKVSTSSATAK